MWFNRYGNEEDPAAQARVGQLEKYHRRRHGPLLAFLSFGLVAFVAWALVFRIDEVTRATGEVIASKRVQVIQAVDGGVLSQLLVKEGDRVRPGQILARLDQIRVGSTVDEVDARLFALKAKAIRLRAEVTGVKELVFPNAISKKYREQVVLERALFQQRHIGLQEDIRTLQVAVDLSRKELGLVEQLLKSGDASGLEMLRAQRAVNDADARLVNRKNKFLEDARIELARAEDEIAQNVQVLTRHQQELQNSIFTAQTMGIVKNVRVTTVGGVLRAGEEIMQIVPTGDELIVEAKVRPADIARVRPNLDANIRFDPFDYTIFGSVPGKVIYISADTLKENTNRGEDVYYRVHVSCTKNPVTTATGKTIEILPGMTAQIDIRTGDRTLMNFLLKPVRKTLSEAFGER